MYIHTIGRIGKDAQVIEGKNGKFLSMDIAVDDFNKGENITTWVRIRSSKNNHIKLAKYLTKGRIILVEGTLAQPQIWIDKNNVQRVQLSITADSVQFVNTGKKRDGETIKAESMPEQTFPAPADKEDDLPFWHKKGGRCNLE